MDELDDGLGLLLVLVVVDVIGALDGALTLSEVAAGVLIRALGCVPALVSVALGLLPLLLVQAASDASATAASAAAVIRARMVDDRIDVRLPDYAHIDPDIPLADVGTLRAHLAPPSPVLQM